MLGCALFGPPTDDTNQFADVNAKWFTGTVGPDGSLGVDGDLYMNAATGEIFVKMSGSWVASGNVTGPEGPAGPGSTVTSFVYTYTSADQLAAAAGYGVFISNAFFELVGAQYEQDSAAFTPYAGRTR